MINEKPKEDIDPTTGMPVLPKGYFFRVSVNAYGEPRVDVYERRWFIFRRYTGGYSEGSPYYDLDEQRVYEIAARAKTSFEYKVKVKSLLGNYPPKKLPS